MTEREMAIVSAYTGILLGKFCEMHKYIEQIMERPVFTHEMGDKKTMEEIKRRSKRDFCDLTVTNGTLLKPQPSEPEPKPLARYLGDYVEHELNENRLNVGYDWRELLEQALDAYESTEGMVIQIIKKKAKI